MGTTELGFEASLCSHEDRRTQTQILGVPRSQWDRPLGFGAPSYVRSHGLRVCSEVTRSSGPNIKAGGRRVLGMGAGTGEFWGWRI